MKYVRLGKTELIVSKPAMGWQSVSMESKAKPPSRAQLSSMRAHGAAE